MSMGHLSIKQKMKKQKDIDRASRRDLKNFDRETDIARVRFPKQFRLVFMAWCILNMIVGVALVVYFLVVGVIVSFEAYLTLIAIFIMGPVFALMYPQAHAADERTTKIQFGDMAPIAADELSPGKHLIRLPYPKKLKESKGKEQYDYHTYEVMRGGDLNGAWLRANKPVIFIGLTQFSPGDDGTPRHTGYMVGNTYHVPVEVKPYTFRMLQAARDPRLAKEIKRIEGIGSDIKPTTWVLVGSVTRGIPSGIPQGGSPVEDKELWYVTRLLRKRTKLLQKHGYDEVTLEALNM